MIVWRYKSLRSVAERKEKLKTCPNCNELVGDHVTTCFNCGWNFEDIQNNSSEGFTREKLALLNNATIIKMKHIRNKTILTTIGVLACLVGSVGLLRLSGAGSKILDEYANIIMVANGVVGPFGMIRAYIKNAAIKSLKKGWGKLEAGEISEQSFYEQWLLEVWDFSKTNRHEIEKLISR